MKPRPLGLQLYTVRKAWAQDPSGTLRRLAEIGYREVELFFHELDSSGKIIGPSAKELAAMLRDCGIRAIGSHVPASPSADWDALIEYHLALGCSALGIGAAFYDSIADARRLAKWFNEKAQLCAQNGLGFYYHNHFHEFQKLQGEVVIDVLLREATAMQFELDAYWITRAGLDPVEFIRKHGPRISMLHLKDMSPQAHPVNLLEVVTGRLTPDNVFTAPKDADSVELGTGCMNIAAILAEAEKTASIHHLIIEQDCCPGEELKSAEISYANYQTLAASIGESA